jgi:HlyD family secretion protein
LSRGKGALALGSLLAAFAIGYVVLRERGRPVRVAAVSRGALRVAVACAGVLQPPPGGELRARQPATVARILAGEGARVRRGEPILELSDPELLSRERQAREEVLQLEAEATAASEEAARARKEAERRREIVSAERRLLEQGAIPRVGYEASAAELLEAEARLVSAEARARALRAAGAAPSRLSLARARAADLAERVAALTLRAPADGVVYGLPRREGEAVAAGQVVASVTDPDRPEVRVKVDQPDLPRIAEGQRIVVTFDGLPERRFEGRLHGVSRSLRDSGGREVAEVLGAIGDPDHLLPWNASVNVEVVVLERESALLVPRTALQRDGDRRFVYVPKDGRALRREVKPGAMSSSEAEVETGLAEGEWVILPGTAPLRDGARVRLAKP